MLAVVLVCSALLAATPYALSHPAGLRASLAVANAAAPVRIHVDSFSAGWASPVVVEGVRVVERSSANKAQRAQRAGMFSPVVEDSVSTSDDDGGGSGGTEHGEPGQRRATLFAAERVRTTSTLWSALRGANVDVLVTRPQVDVTFNAAGTLRVAQALEDAGLVPPPRPPAAARRGPVAALVRAAAAAAQDDGVSSSSSSSEPDDAAAAKPAARRGAGASSTGTARALSAVLDMAVPSGAPPEEPLACRPRPRRRRRCPGSGLSWW